LKWLMKVSLTNFWFSYSFPVVGMVLEEKWVRKIHQLAGRWSKRQEKLQLRWKSRSAFHYPWGQAHHRDLIKTKWEQQKIRSLEKVITENSGQAKESLKRGWTCKAQETFPRAGNTEQKSHSTERKIQGKM
jgi:hypothetical protein